jgi:hypothetical protein
VVPPAAVPAIAIGDDRAAIIRSTIIAATIAAAVIAIARIIDAAAKQPGQRQCADDQQIA